MLCMLLGAVFFKDEWIGECIVLGVLLDFTTVKLLA
jgi:hypothetical protein